MLAKELGSTSLARLALMAAQKDFDYAFLQELDSQGLEIRKIRK